MFKKVEEKHEEYGKFETFFILEEAFPKARMTSINPYAFLALLIGFRGD
jgi:hypothetical protein